LHRATTPVPRPPHQFFDFGAHKTCDRAKISVVRLAALAVAAVLLVEPIASGNDVGSEMGNYPDALVRVMKEGPLRGEFRAPRR
jgi:hypothetical protein